MSDSEQGRILLVDHSRGALLFQETILRRRDQVIFTALSGGEGLLKARREQPQLIVFGFDLFDMNAPEFCRDIRADESTAGVSLLLVCERESPEHVDLCMSAGCNDVIYRPLQKRDLDEKVERLTRIPVRRELRTITKIEVSVENNGRFHLARSINISSTGMLVEVDRVLPGDGHLRLHFYLPGDPKPMQIEAQIVRAEFSGAMAKYGFRFTSAGDGERLRIDQYVHRLRSRETI
jgi:two-component system, OmpR family, alkaline phosphatase synthesis response regulator PhoP